MSTFPENALWSAAHEPLRPTSLRVRPVQRAARSAAASTVAARVLGHPGRPEGRGAGRFQQGDRDRSKLRPGLCQSGPDLSADRQARSRARRLQQGALDRSPTMRSPISAAASSTGCAANRSRHSPTSTRQSTYGPIAGRPITIAAACSTRASDNTSSPSTIFTTAIGLSPQESEPFIARGLSYIAIGDFKAGASDLDDAVQLDPQNLAGLDEPRACL